MFGFGKKKAPEPPPNRPNRPGRNPGSKEKTKAQLNLFGVPGIEDGDIDLEVDDDDIENELLALMGEGGGIPKKPRPRAPASAPVRPSAVKQAAPAIDPFAIPNYEIESGDDDEDDDDIDDADLEAELGELTGAIPTPEEEKPQISKSAPPQPPSTQVNIVQTLQERLYMYQKAKSNADAANETSKSRRFARGLQTLEELLKKAKAGRAVDESEIPPMVATGEKKPPPPPEDNFPPPASSTAAIPSHPKPEPDFFPIVNESNKDDNDSQIPQSTPDTITVQSSFLPPADTFQGSKPPVIPFFNPIPQVPTKVEQPTPEPQKVNLPLDPLVEQRLKDYKKMAVVLKRSGDSEGGLNYLKLAKALEGAIKSGNPVDLSAFPAIPEQPQQQQQPPQQNPSTSTTREEVPTSIPVADTTTTVENPSAAAEGENLQLPNELFSGPEPPKTIMEALQQRLDKYKSEVEKANSSNNSSKARRMGRIVKQYEEAIALYKRGKPVPFDELPTPPGFGPIPIPGASGGSVSAIGGGGGGSSLPLSADSTAAATPQPPPLHPSSAKIEQPASSDVSPTKVPKPEPGSASTPGTVGGISPKPASTSPAVPGGSITRPGKPSTKLTLQEKQLNAILQRQKLFKEAALNAKKRGDIDQAREYLRIAKGFDKLIQASQAGLPVDMNTLPSAPEAVLELESEDYELVSGEDCIEPTGSIAEVFSQLEEDLKNQIKICMRTRDHYKSIGDVGSANRFEKLALESKRDLDTLRLAAKQGSSIPKYHYETRVFSITECNTDLTADEIEVGVIQGVNYRVANPADVDTFVKVEMAYPSSEEAQINKTAVIKDTNNPAYNTTFKMNINRSARNFQRFVHRHGIKFEIWSKGGFLRSSTLIGTGTAKLLLLETKCTIHEAIEILDGRKPVGKLEVKIRLRDPILSKQITQKKEKWLSIDRL